MSASRFVLACMFASVMSVTSAADTDFDPLKLPSVPTARAGRALMTSVVRAEGRLVACGERGIVMLSDDEGITWRQAVTVPVSVTLTKVFFVDARKGWAIGHGGVVLSTDDGGEHWRVQLDGVRAAEIELESANGGGEDQARIRNAERLLKDGADKPFLGIFFADERNGLVVGAYGLAFITADGGQSWQSLVGRINDQRGRHLYDIKADDQGHIFIVGEQGAVYESADRGEHFAALETPWNGTYFGMLPLGERRLLVYGLRGHAFLSDDGGREWAQLALPEVTVTAGRRLNSGAVLLSDEMGRLSRSEDDGRTFVPIEGAGAGPVSSLVEAADSQIILAGANNLSRLSLK